VNDKSGDDQKTKTASTSEGDKAEEPKAVDNVSEQLEKLNVGAEPDGTKSSETQSSDDTVVTSASS